MLIYLLPFFIALLFFLMYESKSFKTDVINIAFFIGLTLIGGTRFETGQDWQGYMYYFNDINLSNGIIESYRSNIESQNFEFGYFCLNYILKYLGFSYLSVFFLASLFSSLSIYKFTKQFSGNKFYIICIYISYSFLLLQFAQVRQSISIGFFLLGLNYFLSGGRKRYAILICLSGCLFQISCLVYILMFITVLYLPESKKSNRLVILAFPILACIIYYVGSFTVLKYILPSSIQDKIDVYANEQNLQGFGLIFYNIYLLLYAYFILKRSENLINTKYLFVCRLAVVSLIMTVSVSVLFSGNYTMYSRIYLLSSLISAYAVSLILSQTNKISDRIFYIFSVLIALGYYIKIVSSNIQDYVPYKSWLF